MDDGEPLRRDVRICNAKGLHARAAAKLVRTTEDFNAEIRVIKDDFAVGGTSILGLMMLAAGIGTVLTITATGDEAQKALDAVVALIEDGFGENR